MENTEFRSCKQDGNDCVFCGKTEYGGDCCTLDRIAQVTYYGCVPQEVIDRLDE